MRLADQRWHENRSGGTGIAASCYYAAELHRLKGELLARPAYPDKRKAAVLFGAAIVIARYIGKRKAGQA